jgi:hypothetical protein
MTDDISVKLDELNHRLAVLIYLQLRRSDIAEMTMGRQIVLLKRLGFSNGEIANLFGMTPSYISSELVRQKRSKSE